ncbi:unnamed protein product [Eruca vesicaria subsp. sativa]|uniref:Uncharacterized protein n=1 Tax=Eruca vesicaria subsp. sativa TaxID=29727 RepID=A0ABC8ITW6_ERUVS|nr:unnamed protein product [Eruca vesicaria subsp. sativa]
MHSHCVNHCNETDIPKNDVAVTFKRGFQSQSPYRVSYTRISGHDTLPWPVIVVKEAEWWVTTTIVMYIKDLELLQLKNDITTRKKRKCSKSWHFKFKSKEVSVPILWDLVSSQSTKWYGILGFFTELIALNPAEKYSSAILTALTLNQLWCYVCGILLVAETRIAVVAINNIKTQDFLLNPCDMTVDDHRCWLRLLSLVFVTEETRPCQLETMLTEYTLLPIQTQEDKLNHSQRLIQCPKSW